MPGQLTASASPLTAAQYRRLLGDLQGLLEQGRQRAELAEAYELVKSYHAMGSRLLAQKLTGNAGYGTATLQRLADDLGLSANLLHRAMAFVRAYPDGPPEPGLRWSHYRELSALRDPERRGWYEDQAREHSWSRTKLVQAIRSKQFAERATKPGKPAKGKRGKTLPRPTEPMHVYKARVIRVVDGDTLLVDVDLGFQVHKEQRLRLAAVDTPDIGDPGAAAARDYVLDRLARVDFVVVQTLKTDLYGRYIAHVFYQPGEADKRVVATSGAYLNRELVERELARVL